MLENGMKIYETKGYVPFEFKSSLTKINEETFKSNSATLMKKELFILTKVQLEKERILIYQNNNYVEIKQNDFGIIKNNYISKNGLYICKLLQKSVEKIIDFHEEKFLLSLFEEESKWIATFLDYIFDHLSHRESENKKLINHEIIKILIGEIITYLEAINIAIKNKNMDYIANDIRSACDGLAKLAGGRAFLSKNVIEMMWTFEIINQIYMA